MFIGQVWADANVLAAERARAAERLEAQKEQLLEASSPGADRELRILQSQIFQANKRLELENRKLNIRQRELELQDPIAKGLREKVIEREKELVELRRSLHSRLEAIPEIQELQGERSKLISEIKKLREQERALLQAASSPLSAQSTDLNTGK